MNENELMSVLMAPVYKIKDHLFRLFVCDMLIN